ncbi:MAG: hypothetical protein WCI61_10660, partial [Chloroflexota bacterium]
GLGCRFDGAPAAIAAVPVEAHEAPREEIAHAEPPSRPEPVELDAQPYLKPEATKALREKVSWYQGALKGSVRSSLDLSA